MNILLSTDNNYVMPTGVLMHSIGENNKVNIDYYVMVNSDFDLKNLKSASNLNGNLNCSKELEHYASW